MLDYLIGMMEYSFSMILESEIGSLGVADRLVSFCSSRICTAAALLWVEKFISLWTLSAYVLRLSPYSYIFSNFTTKSCFSARRSLVSSCKACSLSWLVLMVASSSCRSSRASLRTLSRALTFDSTSSGVTRS